MSEVEIDRLESLVGQDPGATAFPALAEAWRRAGRPERGERVARAGLERRPDALAGRVALGLALLDQGRVDEARAELERVLASVPDHPLAAAALEASGAPRPRSPFGVPPPPAPADEDFLDALAEGEIEDAFQVATPERDAPLTADGVAEDALHEAELELEDEIEEAPIPVATRTVAALLESQGHRERARAMRESLDGGQDERERVIETLERWLENLRKDRA